MPKVDVQFMVTGQLLPADHSYLLFSAICGVVPDLHGDEGLGVFPVNGRLVGGRNLAVTEHSRLTMRLEADRIREVLALAGKVLEVGSGRLSVGVPATKALQPKVRLYSRLVVIKGFTEPLPFLDAAERQFKALEIKGRLSLVPQPQVAETNQERPGGSKSPFLRRTTRIRDKEIVGFALIADNLTADESICLQEQGLGGRRRFGCGLFVPVRK